VFRYSELEDSSKHIYRRRKLNGVAKPSFFMKYAFDFLMKGSVYLFGGVSLLIDELVWRIAEIIETKLKPISIG
jgi:hypothetical protein